MAPERWKEVPGWPGVEVSDRGGLRGATSRVEHGGHIRIFALGRKAYLHRLVLEAFVGPCPPGTEARHLNDVAGDNRIANLAWGTRHENLLDRRVTGRAHRPRGVRNPSAKLDPSSVSEAHALRESGLSQQAIADKLGVNQTTISRVLRGKTWAEGA